jgi:hypothetical protein
MGTRFRGSAAKNRTNVSLFAHDRPAFEHERRQEIERHIANCAECGATFDFYSVAEEDLGDLAVWQPIIGSTAAAMSAYAYQCAAEDAEADQLLKEYFEKPQKAAVSVLKPRLKHVETEMQASPEILEPSLNRNRSMSENA